MTAPRPKAVKAAPPADDRPFDFNLDAVRNELDLRPFRVHFGGTRWEFAHMQALNVWELVSAGDSGDIAAISEVFAIALGREQFAEFRKIPLPQGLFQELFDAYQVHSGLAPGESGGSTGS